MKNGYADRAKIGRLAVFSAVMLILYCIAILISSFFCWKFDVPGQNAAIIFYIIMVSGIVITALIFSAFSKSKGWFNGIIGGMIFIAGVFLLNLIICGGKVDFLSFAVKLPLFVILAFICGIFGVNMRR